MTWLSDSGYASRYLSLPYHQRHSGVLAKVSPQMNMFSVGIQIKIVIGLVIMFFTVAMMNQAVNFIFINTKGADN
nr:flagellar biosynthetic protein FliR [Butyrivibrio sp. FCS014]